MSFDAFLLGTITLFAIQRSPPILGEGAFLNKDVDVEIAWADIKKIGEDVILVSLK